MIPVLGGKVVDGQQCFAIFRQAFNRLVVLRPVFSAKRSIATSADARLGGIAGVAFGRVLADRKQALNFSFAGLVILVGHYVVMRGTKALFAI